MKWLRKLTSFPKKHKKLSIAGLLLVLFLVFLFRPKAPVPPETVTIKRTDLVQSVSVSGSVTAKRQATLTFPSYGKLVYVGARKGDTVSQYETIVAVDSRVLQDNIENSLKTYQNQKIQFDIVNDFNGDRDLSDTGLSVSARRQLQTAVNTLDQTKLALEIQTIAKEQSYVSAPFAGVLVRADADVVGATVSPSTTYVVLDPTSLVFSMDVDEADIAKVKVGQMVAVSLDAFADQTLTLPVETVDYVSHTTTNGGNAFTVTVQLPSDTHTVYRVGMNGNAEITTAEKDHVLSVPFSALIDTNTVYVQHGAKYEKRKVTLGLQNDVAAEVVSGLSAGDIVVTQPDKVPQGKK